MKRFIALLLCAATLLTSLLFVGCGSDEKDEDKGQYITTYLTSNVYDLDPAHAYKNESVANIVGLMFDTLFKLDEKGKVKKSLVEDYVIEEDKEAGEYTMLLYLADTYWSDGTAISANDIVFAWQRLLQVDADFDAAALLFDIKNARAAKEGDVSIDDVGIYPAEQQLLEINFEAPPEGESIDYDQFMLNLTSLALAPLRDDIVSKSDDWAKKAGTMVCSGPFKLGRVNCTNGHPDDSIAGTYFDQHHVVTDEDGRVVAPKDDPSYFPVRQRISDFIIERNAYYYRDVKKDKLDKEVKPYRICVDCSLTDEQLTSMYDEGLIMYVGDIPLSLRKDSSIASDAEVAELSMSTSALYLNQNADIQKGDETVKLFADAKVRQALSMAIDRQTIVDTIVYAEVASGLIPTGMFETSSRKTTFRETCDAVYDYLKTDLSAAEALLKEANIKPSAYTISLTYADYDEVHTAIAGLVAENWKALGFNVEMDPLGTAQNNDFYKYTAETPKDICDDLYAEALNYGSFDAILLDVVPYSPDPYSVLAPYAKAFSGRAMDMSNPEEYKLTPHITGYDSEEYNNLMEEIFAKKTVSDRADLYRQAEALLMEDMPVIPLVFNLDATVKNSKLKGDETDYYGMVDFRDCKVSSYEKYLENGFDYMVETFKPADDQLDVVIEFTESGRGKYEGLKTWNLKCMSVRDCTYTSWNLFVEANTVYSHFFFAERDRLKAIKDAAKETATE